MPCKEAEARVEKPSDYSLKKREKSQSIREEWGIKSKRNASPGQCFFGAIVIATFSALIL
jgi:hypothetical protein